MKINLQMKIYLSKTNSKTTSQFQKHSAVLGSFRFLIQRFPQPGNSFKTGAGVVNSCVKSSHLTCYQIESDIGCNCYTYVYYSLSSFSYATNECIIRWIARWVRLYRLNNTSEVSTLNGNKITLHLKCERKIQNKIDRITSISLTSIQMPLLLS